MTLKKFKYSEIFSETVQGEGHYSGVPTVWIRFFGCNFQCAKFSVPDYFNPTEYYAEQSLLAKKAKSIDELPVIKYGCDSRYSWHKDYAHLAKSETTTEICNKLIKLLQNKYNPYGLFRHPETKQYIHLAFTGGEPMMQQTAISEILDEFESRNNFPNFCTIETNGTQPIREIFQNAIHKHFAGTFREWFWSCSPKLSASGEDWSKAIKPEIVKEYNTLSNKGQLKFVVDGTEESWDEVSAAIAEYRSVGVNWPAWIMPVGATESQQENIQASICEECFRRGYFFSARLHNWIFGNICGK